MRAFFLCPLVAGKNYDSGVFMARTESDAVERDINACRCTRFYFEILKNYLKYQT